VKLCSNTEYFPGAPDEHLALTFAFSFQGAMFWSLTSADEETHTALGRAEPEFHIG